MLENRLLFWLVRAAATRQETFPLRLDIRVTAAHSYQPDGKIIRMVLGRRSVVAVHEVAADPRPGWSSIGI